MNHENQLFVIIIGLVLCQCTWSAPLKIYRCVLENGTISYQETKCSDLNFIKVPKKKPQQIKQKHSNNEPNKTVISSIEQRTIKPVPYAKIAGITADDQSTRIIKAQVKSHALSMQVLNRWSLFNKVYNNKMFHMKALDAFKGGEISLLVDFIFPDNKNFTDKELEELINIVGSQYLNQSKEERVNQFKLNVVNGKGRVATFTHTNHDRAYNYTTKGVIFKNKWLIQFTLLSNDLQSYSHRFALSTLIESIVISH